MNPNNIKFSRHRLLVLVGASLIFLAAVFSTLGLQWQEDILSILPDENPQISKYRKLIKHFNPMDAVFVDVGSANGAFVDQAKIMRVADSLAQKMEASEHFERILYKWDFSELNNTLELFRNHRAELCTAEDSVVIKKMLHGDSIHSKLVSWKRQLAEAPTPFLVQQMLKDPIGLDNVLLSKLSGLQSMNDDLRIIDGRLFSKNGRHILLIAHPKFSASDGGRSRELVDFMDNLILETAPNASVDNIKIAYLAGHRFSVENAQRIKRDIQVTVTISMLAIAVLALLIYSQPFLMLLTLLPAVFGSFVSLGLMRWLVPDISAIVIGSGAMLIGLAVDYGIHVLFHIDQEGITRKDSIRLHEMLQKLKRPLLLSAVTTVLAFLMLRLSILPGYKQLGLFVSMGIISAMGFVLLVLPHLIPMNLKKKKILPTLPLVGIFPVVFHWTQTHKKSIFTILVLVTLAMVPGISRVQFEGDVQKLNAVSDEIKQDWDIVLSSFGSSLASTYVVVTDKDLEIALAKNDRILVALEALKQKETIIAHSSIANVFPSDVTRIRNQRRWDQLCSAETIARLETDLRDSAKSLGFRSNVFKDFLNQLNQKGKLLTIEAYENTLLKDIFSTQVSKINDEYAVLTQIKIKSHSDLKPISEQLKVVEPEVIIYNGKKFVTEIVVLIFTELKRMGLLVLAGIFILLLIMKRKLSVVLVLLLPLLVSAIWTFGSMGWLGIKINIINSIVSVFVFGLVIDYCFFLHSASNNAASAKSGYLMHSGAAVTLSAFTTMFGLGALVLAKHPAMHSLGLTALLGIFFGLVAVLLIVPGYFVRDIK